MQPSSSRRMEWSARGDGRRRVATQTTEGVNNPYMRRESGFGNGRLSRILGRVDHVLWLLIPKPGLGIIELICMHAYR